MTTGTLGTAVAVEMRKARAARVILATTALLVAGLAVLAGSLTGAAMSGNQEVLASLGAYADERGWPLLTGVTAQITATGGLLAFGVGLSWLIGREFADGTITGLFALPVSRPTIALAKLLVYLLWTVVVAAGIVLIIALAGVVIGLGAPDGDVLAALARQFLLTVLTALVAVPVALAATLGRGLLPGIATVVSLIVVAQVLAIAGAGAWFPVVAPALWSIDPGGVLPIQLALVALIPIVFGALTVFCWAGLQLDR